MDDSPDDVQTGGVLARHAWAVVRKHRRRPRPSRFFERTRPAVRPRRGLRGGRAAGKHRIRGALPTAEIPLGILLNLPCLADDIHLLIASPLVPCEGLTSEACRFLADIEVNAVEMMERHDGSEQDD